MEQYNTLHINNLGFTLYENPFYLEALDNNSTVRLNRIGGWSGKTFKISKNNLTSSYYDYDWSVITLNQGERIYWHSEQIGQYSQQQYPQFQMTGRFKVGGNIQSMMNYSTSVSSYCFYRLFYECSSLVDASDLSLPATTLATSCYHTMFGLCTSLVTHPAVLPATTLADNCYQQMFGRCDSMTTAPALPATTLAEYCYNSMFFHCVGLETAPALPATTLAEGCYSSMFYECTSLGTAPALPATTPVDVCYRQMFYNCTFLNYIKCMLEEVPSSSLDLLDWVKGVGTSSQILWTPTFVKSPNATFWTTGNSGIPNGWTVVDAS